MRDERRPQRDDQEDQAVDRQDDEVLDAELVPLDEEERADAGEPETEDRPRRRRRRRGGRKRRSGEGADRSAPSVRGERETDLGDTELEDGEEGLSPDLAMSPDVLEGGLDADDVDDAEEEDDEDARLKGHRGIPSWDDAIGFIVGANMEARAKNPTPGRGGRGRGGRGRDRS
jgi:ribonuclease E